VVLVVLEVGSSLNEMVLMRMRRRRRRGGRLQLVQLLVVHPVGVLCPSGMVTMTRKRRSRSKIRTRAMRRSAMMRYACLPACLPCKVPLSSTNTALCFQMLRQQQCWPLYVSMHAYAFCSVADPVQ
jgi:hypothetical protein